LRRNSYKETRHASSLPSLQESNAKTKPSDPLDWVGAGVANCHYDAVICEKHLPICSSETSKSIMLE
ncbi:TPA: hypothetical protein ACG5A4_006832, partial [Pseudomonas aeruginosa]